MSSITLLVADDHNIIRSGICALLKNEPDFQILGEAKSGREAIVLTRQLQPNVLIMDLAMPLLNGAEATRQIVRECQATKVIILSSYQDDVHVEASMSSGAAGYLLKATAASEIIQAVREVHKGNAYFSPIIAETLRARAISQIESPKRNLVKTLTTRETEVFQLVAEGFSNKQIASELNISIKTVEKHRQSLMGKLNIHCTAGLTRHAANNGIIETLSSREILSPAH